jgi:hypothetical protein
MLFNLFFLFVDTNLPSTLFILGNDGVANSATNIMNIFTSVNRVYVIIGVFVVTVAAVLIALILMYWQAGNQSPNVSWIVTTCTTYFQIQKLCILPTVLFMCFEGFSQLSTIFSLKFINRIFFLQWTCNVFTAWYEIHFYIVLFHRLNIFFEEFNSTLLSSYLLFRNYRNIYNWVSMYTVGILFPVWK